MDNKTNSNVKKSSQPKKLTQGQKQQENRNIKKQKVQETIAILKKQFPLAFKENPEPLKVGILEDILEKLQGKISKHKIKDALKYYTRNLLYHQAVLINTHRIDLEGKRCELITAHQKEYSQKGLGMILVKNQKMRKS